MSQVPALHEPLRHCVAAAHGEPAAFFATHAGGFALLSQNPSAQSLSLPQAPAARHFPFDPHLPLRQTRAASFALHGPSPSAYPHLLSALSQTVLVQTAFATATLQVPSSAGVCPAIVGIAAPFARRGKHFCWAVSQNCV